MKPFTKFEKKGEKIPEITEIYFNFPDIHVQPLCNTKQIIYVKSLEAKKKNTPNNKYFITGEGPKTLTSLGYKEGY